MTDGQHREVSDQRARSDTAEVRALLREHVLVCAERDKNEAALLESIRGMLGDLKTENDLSRNENSARFARQQEVNSELFVKLSRADSWRDDQLLMRASLAGNGALFAACIALILHATKVM